MQLKNILNIAIKKKNDLWNTATFVFDTNVFLNLYRYSNKTRDQLIESFEWLKSRIWMPYQVALEFCKERYSVINEANRRFDNIGAQAGTLVDSWRKELRLDANDSDVEELAKYMEGWIRKKKESNYCIFDAADDDVLSRLLDLFEGKTGKGFSSETKKGHRARGRKWIRSKNASRI